MKIKMAVTTVLSTGLVLGGSVPGHAAPAVADAVVVAEKCSSDTDDYGLSKWSSVTHRMCAKVIRKGDGSLEIEGRWVARMTYYWGAAWYTEACPPEAVCNVRGELRLREGTNSTAPPEDIHRFDNPVHDTGHFETRTTWKVKPGTSYKTDLYIGFKSGGYWKSVRDGDKYSNVELARVNVTVTTPS